MYCFPTHVSRLANGMRDSRNASLRNPLIRRLIRTAAAAGLAVGAWALLSPAPVQAMSAATGEANADSALAFNQAQYTPITVTIDGNPVAIRWYKELCYVAKPVLMADAQVSMGGPAAPIANPRCGYQSMNIFVPERAINDQQTALYFAVNNGGWFASYVRASVTDGATFNSAISHVGAALKAGYVFIDVASRSRGIVAADGSYPGKSPAAIVDVKAAVRYLRLNDAAMPGNAERIVVNGTSGGGALVSILGASGNSRDYLPYLAEIGAAGIDQRGHSTIRDDVFAINAYCPITDLGNADLAYEWLYTTLDTRKTVSSDPDPKGSAEIAAKFSAYQRSLKLTNAGKPLTADTMLAAIQQEVLRSAETYMTAAPGNVIPDLGETMTFAARGGGGPPGAAGMGAVQIPPQSFINDWIDVDNATKKVVSIDMQKYLKFVTTQATLKPVPAFDPTGISTYTGMGGETNLFGTREQKYSNYTEFSWNHNDTRNDGIGQDDTGLTWAKLVRKPTTLVDDQVKLINPMSYIGTAADTAPYWYIRHGTRDRDTAFTVSINLSRALAADRSVADVNYRLAWNQPHAGNYDIPEVMQWIADSLKAANTQGGKR